MLVNECTDLLKIVLLHIPALEDHISLVIEEVNNLLFIEKEKKSMTLQHNPKHTDGGNYKYFLRLLDRHQTFIVIYSNVKILFFFSFIQIYL